MFLFEGKWLSKKWVFDSLVTDDKDAIGLIAYALYKHKKHTLAVNLRDEGKDEDTIQKEVNTFHDQTLQNNSLDDYRDKATKYLSDLIQRVQDDERAEFDKEKVKLAKAQQNELKNQRSKILKNMREYQSANKSMMEKLGNWLLSGIPGIVSSFILTCFFLGASMLLVTQEKRQEVFAELVSKYLGVVQTAQAEPQKKDQSKNPWALVLLGYFMDLTNQSSRRISFKVFHDASTLRKLITAPKLLTDILTLLSLS